MLFILSNRRRCEADTLFDTTWMVEFWRTFLSVFFPQIYSCRAPSDDKQKQTQTIYLKFVLNNYREYFDAAEIFLPHKILSRALLWFYEFVEMNDLRKWSKKEKKLAMNLQKCITKISAHIPMQAIAQSYAKFLIQIN